jgi:hypothetical protein
MSWRRILLNNKKIKRGKNEGKKGKKVEEI